MRNLMIWSGLIAVSGVLTVGCSGGGSLRLPTGTVCSSTMNPIPLDPKGAEKISLDPVEAKLPAGSYEYAGAEIYYRNKKTGIQLHVVESKNAKTGAWVNAVACANGFKPSTNAFSFSTSGVTSMKVDTSGKSNLFDVRGYSVNYNGKLITRKFEQNKDAHFESPSKVYDGVVSQYAFFKMAPKDEKSFQIRSVEGDSEIQVSVLVRLTRTPPLAAAK